MCWSGGRMVDMTACFLYAAVVEVLVKDIPK
jgi:hypothetical protein